MAGTTLPNPREPRKQPSQPVRQPSVVLPPKAQEAASIQAEYSSVYSDSQAEIATLKAAQMGAIDATAAKKIAELEDLSKRAEAGVRNSYAAFEREMANYTGPAGDAQHADFTRSLGAAANAGPSYVADAMNKYADPHTYAGMMKAVTDSAQYHRDQNIRAGKKEVDDAAAAERTNVELAALQGKGVDLEDMNNWIEQNYDAETQNRAEVIKGLQEEFGLSSTSAQRRVDDVLKTFDVDEAFDRRKAEVGAFIQSAVDKNFGKGTEADAVDYVKDLMRRNSISEKDYSSGALSAAVAKAWENAAAAREGKKKPGWLKSLGRDDKWFS